MLRKLQTFAKLPAREKALFVEAYCTLGVMRAAILTLPFKRLVRSLEQHGGSFTPPEADGQRLEEARRIGRAIERAARYTPWESACLAQALTARRMLETRGIGGVFYLGVSTGDETEKKMSAHAWTKYGDYFLTGGRGSEKFTPLSAFGWEGKR
jgi:hypothetical protein